VYRWPRIPPILPPYHRPHQHSPTSISHNTSTITGSEDEMSTPIYNRFVNFINSFDFTLLNDNPIMNGDVIARHQVYHPVGPIRSSTFVVVKLDYLRVPQDKYWHRIQIRERVRTQPASDDDIRATLLVPRGTRTVEDDDWKIFLIDAFLDHTEQAGNDG
jgi:hypothetical protein